MNARFPPQAKGTRADSDGILAERRRAEGFPGRACCCPATAVVQVNMPPSPARPHETSLLLCGHHYRLSVKALTAAHAVIIKLSTAGPSEALLPPAPAPRPAIR
jgi:hypothetical protein